MIVIDPIVSFIAGAIIVGIYATLMRVGMKARWGDVRSGMFLSIATWAARQASHLPKTPKSWTPNLLVPLEEPRESPLIVQFARDLCYPGGSVIAYSVANADKAEREKELEDALQAIREDKIFCISAAIDNRDFALTSKTLIQFLRNIFLRPNILFITLGDDPSKDAQIKAIIDSAIEQEMGLAILKINPKSGFNLRKDVNLALRDRSPNIDLAILLALQLSKNWDRSRIHLVALSRNEAESVSQANFFAALKEDARMPSNTEIRTVEGQYPEDLARWPRCDIAIFGIGHEVSLEQMRQVASIGGFSCLFVRDSGEESAFD